MLAWICDYRQGALSVTLLSPASRSLRLQNQSSHPRSHSPHFCMTISYPKSIRCSCPILWRTPVLNNDNPIKYSILSPRSLRPNQSLHSTGNSSGAHSHRVQGEFDMIWRVLPGGNSITDRLRSEHQINHWLTAKF